MYHEQNTVTVQLEEIKGKNLIVVVGTATHAIITMYYESIKAMHNNNTVIQYTYVVTVCST